MKYCKWCADSVYHVIKDPYRLMNCPFEYDSAACPTSTSINDYKDAAEFEARVALELLRPVRCEDDNSPCIYGNSNLCTCDCPSPCLSCKDARLKWARLRAEEQMES